MRDDISWLERRWASSGDPEAALSLARAYIRRGDSCFQARVLTSGLFRPLPKNAQGRPEYLHLSTGMVFVEVPAGSFTMGSDSGEPETRPAHPVSFARPFLVGKYPVTQGQWKMVSGGLNPSSGQGTSGSERDAQGLSWDDHPVESVTWSDIEYFCRETGTRLLTESMYEYMARAGSSTDLPCDADQDELSRYGWFGLQDGQPHRAVGQLLPNSWGIYDVVGNVLCWTQDVYFRSYRDAPSNGFMARGDQPFYNDPLWLGGSCLDLLACRYGARPLDQDITDLDEVCESSDDGYERRIVCGVNVRVPSGPVESEDDADQDLYDSGSSSEHLSVPPRVDLVDDPDLEGLEEDSSLDVPLNTPGESLLEDLDCRVSRAVRGRGAARHMGPMLRQVFVSDRWESRHQSHAALGFRVCWA